MRKPKLDKNIFYILLLLALIAYPLFVTVHYYQGILIIIMLNIILATSIWLILQTGQASLAHAAFANIGGYTAAALVASYGFSFWSSIPIALAAAAISAMIIGFISLRLKSHYFLIVTAAFGEIIRILFSMINEPFGGLIGILSLPPPDPIAIPGLPAIDFSSKTSFYYLVLILMVAVVVFISRLATSRTGQCFHAIAQHELRAEHAGINTMGYKMLAFTVGSTIAGLAGVLVAFHSRCMLPTTFTFWHGIYCLIYVAVGGGMTIAGPIAGATVFNLLSQVLRPIQTLEPIVYGFALMLVMIFFRGGLIGAFEKFRAYLMRLFKVKQMI